MRDIDQFLRFRERVITSRVSRERFAPDSPVNLWHFAGGGNNEEVFAYIRQYGLQLINVRTTESKSLPQCPLTEILFVTTWEPYSAITIGTMRRAFDAGRLGTIGIVFFEHFSDDIRTMKQSSWYWPQAYVLAPESFVVRSMIRRAPFRIIVGSGGFIEEFIEGIVE